MIRPAASIIARCENACGKLPRCLVPFRLVLLGIEAQRRRDVQQPFHQFDGAPALTDHSERRDEPERADEERALLAGHAIVGLVRPIAEHEPVLGQLVGDRVDGRPQPGIVGGQESELRGEQGGRIECVGVVVLPQHAALAHPVLEDVGPDLLRRVPPHHGLFRVAPDLG